MDMPTLRHQLLLLVSFFVLVFSGWAAAEPPSRAARLSYISGTVSFSPAGEPDWVRGVVNRPLTTGDRLWADDNSRAELEVGGAAIRLGTFTSVTLLNLDDRIAQLQLTQGTLKVRVRRIGQNQAFEVNTPNLAVTLRRVGEYRIDVDPNGDATAVMVQSGRAEVYGDGASYVVNSAQGYRFYGSGLSDYERLAARRDDDDLDRWARDRDRRGDNSQSARYVSPELVGYEDLDANGSWRVDPNYGNVWTPTRVAAGWTPYRDGHWTWVDPWGWSWVDDAPWGYAVSHYGRWANIRGAWVWVPGPPREQAVYAPALVAFVGGNNFQATLSIGSAVAATVGWFPLAPREVYQPSYPVSRRYFDSINRSNAVIAPAAITNVYNTTNITNNTTIVNKTINVTKVVYVNQRVTGAVVAVPTQAFVQSQPVAKAAVRVSRDEAARAPVVHAAAVAPVQQSVHGGAPTAGAKPPTRERAVVARTAPPPPPVAFAAQQQQLAAKPGAPIDDMQRKQLKPTVPAVPAPKVSMVTTAQVPAPIAPPPTIPPSGKSRDARKSDTARAEGAKGDAAKADAANIEAAKAATAKGRIAKDEAVKAEAARAEAAKTESVKADAAKAANARAEAAKANAMKTDAAKADAANIEAAKAATAKGRIAKDEAVKAEAAKAEAAKTESVRADAAKGANAKADAAKAEAMKTDAAKADAAKGAAVRADVARTDAARAEATKADAAKAEAANAAAARTEAARANTAKAEAMKADAARAATAKAEAANAAAARAEAARANTAKAEAMNADAARAATAKAEAANAAAVRAEAARANAAKAEAMKADAARAAAARVEAAKAEAARAASAKSAGAPPPAARPPASKPAPDAAAEEDKGKGKKKPE